MNDLEMYREQLSLCDDKIIDALVERGKIVEKIMAYKEEWKQSLREINTKKRFMIYSEEFYATANGYRQESSLAIILC